MQVIKIYPAISGSNCDGNPEMLSMKDVERCSESSCASTNYSGDTYYNTTSCTNLSSFEYAAQFFKKADYVVFQMYAENSGCQNIFQTNAFEAAGDCVIGSSRGNTSLKASITSSGSINIVYYHGHACGKANRFSNRTVSSGACVQDENKYYSSVSLNSVSGSSSSSSSNSDTSSFNTISSSNASNPVDSSKSSGSDTAVLGTNTAGSGITIGAIVGIAVAIIAAVVLVVLAFWCYKRRYNKAEASSETESQHHDIGGYAVCTSPMAGYNKSTDSGITDFSGSLGLGPRSLAGLWDDEVIAAARIPRHRVLTRQLINRGGYGEVYYGVFNGEHVAVKMLFPELRKSVKHVNDFLDEVRVMTKLNHPRIVKFVGIAWDSLADLCVVSEYMEGGDLRALLTSYEEQGREVGFDRSKVTIALHIAHALTYLHSLAPPVIHRDLKSKNILLSSDLDAKLTDFGISRERVDRTMTAGVGTSLWMAPEVMIGERYDGKADMFSFGVVLSELDLHSLPYSHAKDSSNSGKKMADTAILHMVALGNIRVRFSSGALESMVALGLACVSLDPADRPTAAEALYKLQIILKQDI